MYKYLLQSVEGVQWFGIGSLLLFFITFCTIAIRAFIAKKEDMDRMARLPLEDQEHPPKQ
jgi:cbb3-type cytochrome oxidase subunit 3